MLPLNASACSCGDVDIAPPRRPLGALEIQILPENLPDKARVYIGSGVMQVGGPWWDGLNEHQKVAVVSHELAHEENPTERCESCIDGRAGAMMRHFGFSRDAVKNGFAGMTSSRNSARAAVEGWDAAESAIAAGVAVRAFDSFSMFSERRGSFDELDEELEGQTLIGDGFSEEDPSIIDAIVGGAPKGSTNTRAPISAAPRTPAPPAPPPALSRQASIAIGIAAALAVAVLAGVVVHALTKGRTA